jgi:DNA segregation ATPase FtsK/SpoIIIE-like protein
MLLSSYNAIDQQYISWKDSQKETKKYKDELSLPINLGKDIDVNWVIKDLSNIENILISGAMGTSKTNFLDTVIYSLGETYSPEKLKLVLLVLVDCKLLHRKHIKSLTSLFLLGPM